MSEVFKPEKISPNYVNEVSRLVKQRMSKLIETARDFGVEIFSLVAKYPETKMKKQKNQL